MKNRKLENQIGALLSAHSEPINIDHIVELTDRDPEAVQKAIASLKNNLEDRGVSLIQHNGDIQLVIDPEFSDIIAKQNKREVDTNLTKAQSEALSVIAYMSPTAKPTIDFVRGVNSRAVLRNLSTRGLIKKDRSGSQTTYSLSSEALQHLGITDTSELPEYEKTRAKLAEFVDTNDVAVNANDE
jgi:segregation and condensation protein B